MKCAVWECRITPNWRVYLQMGEAQCADFNVHLSGIYLENQNAQVINCQHCYGIILDIFSYGGAKNQVNVN